MGIVSGQENSMGTGFLNTIRLYLRVLFECQSFTDRRLVAFHRNDPVEVLPKQVALSIRPALPESRSAVLLHREMR